MNDAELAILSLVIEEERHGYEIEKVIEERHMRDWTAIGFSSIYRILSGLERQGFVEKKLKTVPGRGPGRKVYSITEDGKRACHAATLSALASSQRVYPPFLMGLNNLGTLSLDEAVQSLEEYLHAQREFAKGFKMALETHPMKDDFFIAVFFQYLLSQAEHEISWVEKLIPQLRDFHKSNHIRERNNG